MIKKNKHKTILINVAGLLLISGMLTAIYLIFIWAPVDRRLGIVQKIFYFHVASAWTAFLAYFIVFVLGIIYLINRNFKIDLLASASAEIGILFTTLVLITGSLWGRSSWNVWWTWEPRLTTTLILWFIYIAYFLIRDSIEDPEKAARLSSVYGIIGFIDVPIVFMSIRWWRSRLHPVVFGKGLERNRGGLEPEMLFTLLFSISVFTILFMFLLYTSYKQKRLTAEVNSIKENLRDQL